MHTQTRAPTGTHNLDKRPCDMQTHPFMHTYTHIHWYLTVGQWRGGLRSWIIGTFLSSVIYLTAILR